MNGHVSTAPTIGVLALQGAFAAHEQALTRLGARVRQVRTRADLDAVDALVIPGGESTTMSHLLGTNRLVAPLAGRLADGLPVFGTCAGMILLAATVLDGRSDQHSFGVIDIAVRRNGYGRQNDSFETMLEVAGLETDVPAVFIRAPKMEHAGPAVQVLAHHDGVPVLARQGNVLVASFHPELTGDDRLHRMFLTIVDQAVSAHQPART